MSNTSRLEELGFDPRFATTEQIAVLESLSEQELTLLLDIQRRYEDAGADVEGHLASGGLCW